MHNNNDTITATKLVRNLAAAVNQVRNTGKSLSIVKGKQLIAVLAPPPKQGLSVNQLIEMLGNLPPLEDKNQQFSKDLQKVRKAAELPDSSWD